jgi:hypothetical protein
MPSAEFHRPRGGGGWDLKHGHHNVALGDPRFRGVDGGGVQQFVGAHVEDDEIFASGVEDDESHAGGAFGARRHQRGVHALGGIEIGRNAGELVVSHHGQNGRARSEPCGRHRLVGAFAAGPHVEVASQHRLAENGELRRPYGHADREAADHCDFWTFHMPPFKRPSPA